MSQTATTSLYQVLPTGVSPALPVMGQVIELDASFARAGAWAGVMELVEQAYLAFRDAGRKDVLEEHNYALFMVLPKYRHEISLKYVCLTDTAKGAEKTRNFPLDRAFRLVNGLVGLIGQWKSSFFPQQDCLLVVRGFDQAQHLGTRFFMELVRRLSVRCRLHVLLETHDQALPAAALRKHLQLHKVAADFVVPPLTASWISAGAAFDPHLYAQLQERNEMTEWEEHYAPLLSHWRAEGNTLEAARVALRALCLYNHYGFYYEASSLVDTVLPHLSDLAGDDQETRWNYIGNMFHGLVTTGSQERALKLVEEHAVPYLKQTVLQAKMHYLFAMVFLRYLQQQDIARAELHINQAVQDIAAAKDTIAAHDYAFLKVFIDNGLAFLRVRQGRKEEAVQLCRAGFEFLTAQLGDAGHRLHRSVLLYNSAQVYVQLGQPDEALKFYRASMEMDPYYSEYYNESANLLQRLERYEEALALYDQAIKYSAPYPEVFSNKGVCHTHLEQWEQALACFAQSLELDPDQQDVYLTRAEIFEGMEMEEEALADYGRAIAVGNDSAQARVNRAVLHYGRGELALALQDMNRALELEPENAGHYENRAEIYKALNQQELMLKDLASAERYRTEA